MPGVATNFKILELCRQRLQAEIPGQPEYSPIVDDLANHTAFAYLGALGPAIADFMQPDASANPYARLWRQVFGVVGDNLLNEDGPGLFSLVSFLRSVLDQAIQVAEDEDLGGLNTLADVEDQAKQAMVDVNELLELLDVGYVTELGTIILQDLTPSVTPSITPFIELQAELSADPSLTAIEKLAKYQELLQSDYHEIPPPGEWSYRELLYWKRTGQFAKALWTRAEASGDARLRAYAYGYLISWVGNIVGNPFINSIVESTFRLRWWRSRWISLFVDTWVHGYYEAGASMAGDAPTPPYDDWPSLAEANLQKKIELDESVAFDPQDLMQRLWNNDEFETVLPDFLTDYWTHAFNDVYGDLPQASNLTDNTINGAYQLTWLVLWFQTSGQVFHFISNEIELLEEDADCGMAPPWVTPDPLLEPEDSEQAEGDGENSIPPEIEGSPEKGKFISGIVLAILGGIAIVLGSLLSGGAAVLGGAVGLGVGAALAEGATPDWEKFRCGLFWRKQRLDLTVLMFHDLLVLVGLTHPYPRHLTTEEDVETTSESGQEMMTEDLVTYHSAVKTVKSPGPAEFPRRTLANDLLGLQALDPSNPSPGQFLWTSAPLVLAEKPATIAYVVSSYPEHFVDSLNSPLTGAGVLGEPVLPAADASGSDTREFRLGNAVENVLHLFSHLADTFPNWNLDGDRAAYHPTWTFDTENYPNLTPVIIKESD